ncbi:hypothetical protein QTP88_030045, partial [Uroleucon formosanum]
MPNIKEPRMVPGSQTAAGDNRAGAELTVVDDPANSAFKCQFCERIFTTKIGVGVHMSSAHKSGANDLIVTERLKSRWSDEEKRLLALSEAKLVFGGVPSGGINRELMLKLQGRTLESIKGRRRAQDHRDQVAVFLAGLRGNLRAPVAERDATVSTASVARTERIDDDGAEAVGDRVGSLDHLSAAESGAQKAVDLLSTVTGHGVQKLLTAAQRLVEESRNPNHAIAAWYIEYGKNSRASSVRKPGGRSAAGTNPVAGQSARRKPATAKALKAANYRRNVSDWRKNPSVVADRVLTGVDSRAEMPRANEMLKYWVPIIEGNTIDNSQPQSPVPSQDNDRSVTVLELITPEEVEASLPSAKTAPGPDGFPARLWRRLPCNLIAGLFNMFNATSSLPIQLVRSRTIFVVKKGDPKCPGNYRPISIASIAIRHYHRVLAKRLEKLSVVDSRQRAFRCADGVAENLFLLDSVLKDARSSVKGLCLASLDLSKAFDSVSHESITSAMRGVGLDPRFVEYIRATYQSSETVIQVSGQSSRGIRPRCGVRQGDPLSPLLFNLVVDTGLRAIPDAVGYSLGQTIVNAIAFADDVILVAETPAGLRLACEAFTRRLEVAGLRVNPAKCATLTLVPSGRDRKVKTVAETYSLGGTVLPTLDVASLWRYLGVAFAGNRIDTFDSAAYVKALNRISSEPMKAQMRLAIARDFLVPKFVHGLTFGVSSVRRLRSLAHETRRAVRRWLDLPTSCPNAYIHAPTSAGGLGVPDFTRFVPVNRVKRLSKLENSGVPAVRAAYGLHGKSALAGARRALEAHRLKPSHMQDLYASVDGSELKLCSEESASVAYLRRPHGIPSSDFKDYARIRINALPTRKRVNRGKAGPTRCRACGLVDETLAHVSQACQRTHDGRIMRHDCLVKRITGGLREKRYEVEVEHLYKLHGGNLKPDIVATISDETRGRVSVICDVQVVSGAEPRTWHSCKVDKYADRADLKAAIRARHLSTDVQTVAATLTWRGVWVPESFRGLRELGLSRGLLEGL